MLANKDMIEDRKKNFPKGRRVMALGFSIGGIIDDNLSVPRGTRGTVMGVDATGTVHVAWDNGSTLGVLLEDRLQALRDQ